MANLASQIAMKNKGSKVGSLRSASKDPTTDQF